jgi:putative copper resistance protein D
LNDPLIYVRAIHLAATITVAGVAFFIVFIAEPAFRRAESGTRVAATVRPRLAWIAWTSLALTIVSGVPWFVLVAQSMSDQPWPEVFSQGILSIVLLNTGFGRDWLERLVVAGFLAAMFVPFLSAQRVRSVWINVVVVALAAALVGTLAWAGHAAGGAGVEGIVHPVADFLHLVAAAAWAGTLLPLALLLSAARGDAASAAVARTATLRFSSFGIASVGTILLTGIINTWYLVGGIPALTGTDYGRLLLIKIALFVAIIAIAAVNRVWLTPRLVHGAGVSVVHDAWRQLRRNTVIEAAAGAIIIAIVAVLGVTPPAVHEGLISHAHHSH